MSFVSNGELSAIAARSLDNARRFARVHQVPTAYGGYQALLDNPEIDAVYIATPHSCHFENTTAALHTGKAVLCEKPLTVTPEECRDLIEMAAEHKTHLMEAMWTYFLPAIIQAQRWDKDGRIGKITHVKARDLNTVPYIALY
jgi:predicted dehydrogenase